MHIYYLGRLDSKFSDGTDWSILEHNDVSIILGYHVIDVIDTYIKGVFQITD